MSYLDRCTPHRRADLPLLVSHPQSSASAAAEGFAAGCPRCLNAMEGCQSAEHAALSSDRLRVKVCTDVLATLFYTVDALNGVLQLPHSDDSLNPPSNSMQT